MHAARIAHSTLALAQRARVCAVNSIVAELRANGLAITCRQTRGPEGGRVWLYRLIPPPGGTS